MTRLNIPLFVALAATLLSATDARDQLPHQRMIRKRGPAPLAHFEERAPAFVVPRWPGLVERQEPPVSSSGSVSATRSVASSASASSARETSSSAQASSAAVTPSSSSASVQSTLSASSSSQSGLLDSLTAVLGGSQSSTSAASSTSASSSSSSSVVSSSTAVPSSASSVAPSTSQAAATTPVAQPSPSLNLATTPAATAASSPSQSVAVIYSTASSTPEAAASQAAQERTRKITKNTIISLVVIASCIGGAIAIWTVIRKWKLSPSERFDDRMQPIDWAPTGGAGGVRDDPLAEKASHRRAGSAGSHGSFTSGGVGQSELGHGGAKSIYSDCDGEQL
ncbi:hypothetical protein BDV93DRAFT_255548 [Ceratobasidium sp. AG-I]|nr:hypothetical protein BDV93DRAFT_255548 [Ceratobasidium sp. AG-I]